MTLHARHGSHGPSELVRLQRENEELRTDNERLRALAERNAAVGAEALADNERLTAVISDAPILSKYHGHHGFEVERFIADYETWKRRAMEQKP